MTDKEIMMALECCTKDDNEPNCKECPKKQHIYCMCELLEESLDLIKCQQERIEEYEILNGLRNKRHYYNRFVKEVWQKEKGELSHPDFDEIYKRYFEKQEMIEALIAGQETLQKHFADKIGKILEQLEEWYKYHEKLWVSRDTSHVVKERAYERMIAYEHSTDIVKGVQNE